MIKRLFWYGLLAIALIFAGIVFIPRHYNVPEQISRNNIEFWELPTGSKIAYTHLKAQGVAKPFPVIYLHGGPGGPISPKNIEILSGLAEDGYDVYLYDQIGGGFSARLTNITEYTAERHVQDLEAIIERIGAEKAILIGQSWGAILATFYAAVHEEKIAKIIFTCPGPVIPIDHKLETMAAPDSLHIRRPAFSNAQGNKATGNMRMRAVSYFATAFGCKLASDEEADAFYAFQNGYLNRSLVCDPAMAPKAIAGGGYYASLMTIARLHDMANPRVAIKKATYPVLIMKGQCDNQPWGYTQEYANLFHNSRMVIIPDAGHGIAIEQPEKYMATIRAFLASDK